jgi:hypothetical protein
MGFSETESGHAPDSAWAGKSGTDLSRPSLKDLADIEAFEKRKK